MLRLELLKKLNTVSPALSTNTMIPILTHLCFDGANLTAHDGKIGISVPFKTDFTGAVPATLIELLKASKAKEVELLPGENELLVKAAGSRFKLGLLTADDFVFEMPKPSKTSVAANLDDFLDGIQTCLRSVGGSKPEQAGVTIVGDGKDLCLYSTNDATMTRVITDNLMQLKIKDRVVLSAEFCKQMLLTAKLSKVLRLEIHDDYALFTGTGFSLFGKLIEVDEPVDFEGLLEHHLPDESLDGMITIPTKLKLILDRATIIANTPNDSGYLRISVREGKMRFFSKSGLGEVTDTMAAEGHPEVTAQFKAENLKDGYGHFDQMLITEGCAIMTRGDKLYLISPVGE